MREFALLNGIGDRWNLSVAKSFSYKPEGLGVGLSNHVLGANGNYVVDGSVVNRQSFKLNVAFGENAYADYSRFVGFLNAGRIALEYTTPAGTYLRDCMLSGLSKSELDDFDELDETIEFDFITPWYRYLMQGTGYADQVGDGKVYVVPSEKQAGYHTFAYVYEEGDDKYTGYYFVDNQSVYLGTAEGSPVEVTIHGPVKNPSWRVMQNEKVLATDGYWVDVQDGWKLVVSSFPQEQRAQLVAPNGSTSNVYQFQDLTKTNFVTMPVGKATLMFDKKDWRVDIRVREERVTV